MKALSFAISFVVLSPGEDWKTLLSGEIQNLAAMLKKKSFAP